MSSVLAPGSTFAGYRIEGLLGRGGMGLVYLAVQLGLERQVALKVIASDLGSTNGFRERFMRECRIAASLEHPNILPVYEAGDADGTLFLSMRYVESGDLGALMAGEPLDLDRAFGLAGQIADALDAAHERGLVHRDVKPSNILVDRRGNLERAYLADFGLAKIVSSQSDLTQVGQLVGTLDYVAPEQVRGEGVDARADVYSLACVLYQMVSGQVPYPSDDELAKLWAHMHEPAPTPSTVLPGLPSRLDEVIRRGMAKDPEERYRRAGDLAQAARGSAQPGSAVTLVLGPSTEIPPQAGRRRRWKRALAGLAGTVLVVAAALAVVFLVYDPLGTSDPGVGAEESRVARVLDGDSIVLADGRRVRLAQIDAPQDPGECYGEEATDELRRLLPQSADVRLVGDPNRVSVTKSGNELLRYVLHDGVLVNVELVRRGAAAPWVAKNEANRGPYSAGLLRTAQNAKSSGRGLWGQCPGTRFEPTKRIDTGPSL